MAQVKHDDAPVADRGPRPRGRLAPVRARAAQLVGVVCAICAVILALGVFLVAFRHNVTAGNSIVRLVKSAADAIDGPFSRENGVFHFTASSAKQSAIDSATTKDALFNWGLAALVYLVIGRILARVIAPKH